MVTVYIPRINAISDTFRLSGAACTWGCLSRLDSGLKKPVDRKYNLRHTS